MREELRKIALELDTEKASSFQSVVATKEKVIAGALNGYAKGCPREDILAVMDTSVFGGGKSGFILTEKKLYSSHFIKNGGADKRAVLLDGLIEARWDLNNKNIGLRYDDGSFFEIYLSIYTECMFRLLQEIIALKERQSLKEQEALKEPGPLPEPESTAEQNASADEAEAGKTDEASEAVRAVLEEERKALEKERKTFTKEQKALEKERKALEKERKAFEKEKKALEKEKKALEREKKALEKEKNTLEKERKAFEEQQETPEKKEISEKQPAEEIDKDFAKEKFLQGLKSSQDPDELYEMGKYCEKGDGYEKYYRKAADFYEKAAEKGHADAQLSLAIYYLYGLGVEVDLEKAEYWGKKAEAGKCRDTLSLEMLFDEVEMKKQIRKDPYWA